MPNPNIYVNNQGENLFDNAGHLVLRRALGIAKQQQSANGSFLMSLNGARTRKSDPYYINAKYTAFSASVQNPFGTITHGIVSKTPADKVIFIIPPAIVAISVEGGGLFGAGSSLGYFVGRIGATYEIGVSYPANTKFELVFDKLMMSPNHITNSKPQLKLSLTDDHAQYSNVTTKGSYNWESATPLFTYTFYIGEDIRINISNKISSFLGSNMSIYLSSYTDLNTPFLNPTNDYFVGRFGVSPLECVPRILVSPP